MKRAALVIAIGIATTTTAHAERSLDERWRLEGGLGMRTGSFLVNNHSVVGDDDEGAFAGHVDVGARRARWSGYAEYAVMGLDFAAPETAALGAETAPGDGLMHRFGANARYAFGRIGGNHHASELYVETGLGIQHYRWDDGGHWTRPDLSLGVGLTSLLGWDKQHVGMSVGLRVLLARRDDVGRDAQIGCGGPCNVATTPTGTDRSFMLDVTMHFGT